MENKQVIKGLIKGVYSGDYIAIHKSQKSGLAKEYQVFLASIMAPKMGNAGRNEEPFAFDAREFLREKIIGKKCEFQQEYQYSNRDYGTLIVDGENMNLAIVKQGLAKVLEKRGNMPTPSYYDQLIEAQNEVKQKKTLIWSTEPQYIQKHTREVSYFSETGFNPHKIFEQSKLIDSPLEGIIEYVFSASFVSVYIHKFKSVVKVSMNHLFTPSNADKVLLQEGKLFTEKLLLHRTIGVKFDKVEEGGTFVGRIHHPAGDIAYEVLKNGFSKLNLPKNIDFDAEYYKYLKEAQLIAQTKQMRIWKDYKSEEKKQQKASTSDFTGKVVEIHSGDSLTIERDNDLSLFRVFLATVKAPAMISKENKGQSEPYAWESKENLRKISIGKKVRVVMEFSKTIPAKDGEKDRNMDFATVFLQKNEKNLTVMQLEKGLLKTTVNKSGDNASKFLEDLLAAEKKAVDSKLGIHSNQQAPLRIYNDLVQNAKKAKEFEALIMKRPNKKLNGVVEYCFSGMRFKVRIDSENTSIGFNLLGIKTMANDKNQPQLLEFANKAQNFAKDTLQQRDVTIELDFIDKRGTFFGQLYHKNKRDFALDLVQEGLAEVNIVGGKVPSNIDELEQAQDKAQGDRIGIWAKDLKVMSSSDVKQVKEFQRIQVEMTDITDACRFHFRILGDNQYSKIDSELDKFDPIKVGDLEKPIKKGTLCTAKFSVDNKWYRAKVLKTIGKGQLEVEFIDFGNIEAVSYEDLKKMPDSLLKYEPQAKLCNLAYVRVPKFQNQFGQEAAKIIQKTALEKISDAIVAYQQGGRLSIVLFEKGEKDWNKSVNCQLVEEGLASMENLDNEEDLPQEIDSWYDLEEEARNQQLNIWEFGGAQYESD